MKGGNQNFALNMIYGLFTIVLATIFIIPNFLSAQPASIKWYLNSDSTVSEINGPLYGYDEILSGLYVKKI